MNLNELSLEKLIALYEFAKVRGFPKIEQECLDELIRRQVLLLKQKGLIR